MGSDGGGGQLTTVLEDMTLAQKPEDNWSRAKGLA